MKNGIYNNENNEDKIISLTPELYRNLLEEKADEIMKLKDLKLDCTSTIKTQIDELKKLKAECKNIKRNIKLSKRALKCERKKLFNANKNLRIQKNLVMDLNETFTANDSIIDITRYKTKTR